MCFRDNEGQPGSKFHLNYLKHTINQSINDYVSSVPARTYVAHVTFLHIAKTSELMIEYLVH